MAVPLNPSPSRQTQRALRALEIERKRDKEEKISGWTFVWTIFAFKMVTVAMIWWAANGSPKANAFLTATTWYWAAIPAVAISGFVGYRLRLRRARKHVDALRQAEFTYEDPGGEPWILTEDEVRKLKALESRRHGDDRPGEG